MFDFIKYPRTPHLEGSRLQIGDTSDGQVPLSSLTGGTIVIEEKFDGANTGMGFVYDLRLQLQSRGHPLVGGPRENQFALFKAWAQSLEGELAAVLGMRYIVYGEWMFAKHTVFYDALPHYFLEFDVYDREGEFYLSTDARADLLKDLPIVSVPVIHRGALTKKQMERLIVKSLYKTEDWRASLQEAAASARLNVDKVFQETDASDLSEGLYVKLEANGRVIGRYKFIRAGFLQAIESSGTHWSERPIVINRLADGVDIFNR